MKFGEKTWEDMGESSMEISFENRTLVDFPANHFPPHKARRGWNNPGLRLINTCQIGRKNSDLEVVGETSSMTSLETFFQHLFGDTYKPIRDYLKETNGNHGIDPPVLTISVGQTIRTAMFGALVGV